MADASGEIIVRVRHQPGFVFADQVEQQRLGIALCTVRMRAVAKLRFAVVEPVAQLHQAAWSLSALSCSAW